MDVLVQEWDRRGWERAREGGKGEGEKDSVGWSVSEIHVRPVHPT